MKGVALEELKLRNHKENRTSTPYMSILCRITFFELLRGMDDGGLQYFQLPCGKSVNKILNRGLLV